MTENERISIRARTVAVVGAGPSGVIAAKYLRAEKAFDKIDLFEQRSQAGGIWTYTGDQRDENLFSIPQENPEPGVQEPEWKPKDTISSENNHTNSINGTSKVPSFLSPMYEQLETNIPRGLMGFQDLDWPSDSQLFPHARHRVEIYPRLHIPRPRKHPLQHPSHLHNPDHPPPPPLQPGPSQHSTSSPTKQSHQPTLPS
ncbi:TrkA, flavoprotein involved in K+ transport [Pyrenophora tritici-repentis]|uniref:TrkA, flavoprotein involved in K+ transport n=1 Tax=Pyrenophora tritici-repentis TaxID=45151 RepID=A0A316ZLK5_9PLEO|nr:TrkA, flavoprotein involved in K+ transport [Pyrenophora tritici-repentis]